MLLCYEVTRDLPIELIDIETPVASMKAPQILGKEADPGAILRAGVGLLDGMLARSLRRGWRISASIATPERSKRSSIISRLRRICRTGRHPDRSHARDRKLACAATSLLKSHGAKDIRFACLLAAPEGVAHSSEGARQRADMDRRGRRAAERSWLHRPRIGRRRRQDVRHQVAPSCSRPGSTCRD